MHRNYFTLYHAARELDTLLAGGYLFEVFSQEKNEVRIAFVTKSGAHLQLLVMTGIPELSIATREGLDRKGRNTVPLMRDIEEKEILGVEMDPCDRIIRIHLENSYLLELRLFTAMSNVVLLRDGSEIEAFKKHTGQPSALFGKNILKELEQLALHGTELQQEDIPGKLPGFDRSLCRELFRRADATTDPKELHKTFVTLFFELLDPFPAVISNPEERPRFTILQTDSAFTEPCQSVLDGLGLYSRRVWQFRHVHTVKKQIRHALEKQLHSVEAMQQGMEPAQLLSMADQYEKQGHLLMANLSTTAREPESIKVQDIFSEHTPETIIRLQPELDLYANAERYFRKAAKAKEKQHYLTQKAEEHTKKKALFRRLLIDLESCRTPRELREFRDTHKGELQAAEGSRKNRKGASPSFRSYQISSRATLYVGRNPKNNDKLTFEFAKPNDIWLHARGAAGSHGILRGSAMQNRTEIEEAASIVAFYSSAKNSELVPVTFTEKKYIRRNRHLPPGQVLIDREKTVLVKPREN